MEQKNLNITTDLDKAVEKVEQAMKEYDEMSKREDELIRRQMKCLRKNGNMEKCIGCFDYHRCDILYSLQEVHREQGYQKQTVVAVANTMVRLYKSTKEKEKRSKLVAVVYKAYMEDKKDENNR